MNRRKICIVGNSVALRTRPHLAGSENYGQLLETKLNDTATNVLYEVQNRAFSRATSSDVLEISQALIAEFPILYIINIGVCDAATREIPLWMANILNRSGKSLMKTILAAIHHYIIKPRRGFFTKIRGQKPWVSPKQFEDNLQQLLYELSHNTSAKFILLSINKANHRIEAEIPGSGKNYLSYSTIIEKIAAEKDIPFIDTHNMTAEQHYPDGTHFNEAGHEIITARLMTYIDDLGLIVE